MKHIVLSTALVAVASPLFADNRIDGQSPDAPALSGYGPYDIGVRQLNLVNRDQIDVANIDPTADPSDALPRYDRELTVELWYPAISGATGDTSLDAYIRDGTTQVELEGRAVRDAAAASTSEPLPLVLLSHGYPGNRFLMSHLAESIASRGYVVASIDHTDSTYRDIGAFSSTLVNRPLDQLFVLDEMARLNEDPSSDLAGLIDANNAALIGYSMGGYGALVTAGAGLTEGVVNNPFVSPQGVLAIHQEGSATHDALPDERIRTAIAIGPWGMNNGLWDAEGLAGIGIPLLFIAGSDDTVSGYEDGVRAIWEGASNVERSLLTFDGGSHNTAAPIPAPAESFYFNSTLGFNVSEHYTDPVWDTVFMNNVAQHFTSAWLDVELRGNTSQAAFLDLTEIGSDGVWSVNGDGSFAADHTYWAGFQEGTAEGLRFERLSPAPVPLPASVWLMAVALGGIGLMRRTKT